MALEGNRAFDAIMIFLKPISPTTNQPDNKTART